MRRTAPVLANVDCGENYQPDHLVEEGGVPVGLGPQGEQHGVHILLHFLQGSGLENSSISAGEYNGSAIIIFQTTIRKIGTVCSY
jgi:hypothetical protein